MGLLGSKSLRELPDDVVMLPEPWRRGRRCATCQDSNMDDLECLAFHRSGTSTLPVGGFDERDPSMDVPLNCWRTVVVVLLKEDGDGQD